MPRCSLVHFGLFCAPWPSLKLFYWRLILCTPLRRVLRTSLTVLCLFSAHQERTAWSLWMPDELVLLGLSSRLLASEHSGRSMATSLINRVLRCISGISWSVLIYSASGSSVTKRFFRDYPMAMCLSLRPFWMRVYYVCLIVMKDTDGNWQYQITAVHIFIIREIRGNLNLVSFSTSKFVSVYPPFFWAHYHTVVLTSTNQDNWFLNFHNTRIRQLSGIALKSRSFQFFNFATLNSESFMEHTKSLKKIW